MLNQNGKCPDNEVPCDSYPDSLIEQYCSGIENRYLEKHMKRRGGFNLYV
jgi:hypothetical protein